MYYDYSNSEACFLAVYMASKLEQGAQPFVHTEELQKALNDFISSNYYSSGISEIKKLKFEGAEKLAKNFQNMASKGRSWLKPCFNVKDGKLFPTYEFFNFNEEHNALTSFLWGYNFPKDKSSKETTKTLSTETKNAATITAKYLTKLYAQKYINHEAKYGRWPIHMTSISNIFKKDLGSTLGLVGTKEYFLKFYHHLRSTLAQMIENENGHLIINNRESGNLAYNNLKRLLVGYENLQDMNGNIFAEVHDTMFNLEIDNGAVKVNETTLTFSDPYGEWSDEYDTTEVKLK